MTNLKKGSSTQTGHVLLRQSAAGAELLVGGQAAHRQVRDRSAHREHGQHSSHRHLGVPRRLQRHARHTAAREHHRSARQLLLFAIVWHWVGVFLF